MNFTTKQLDDFQIEITVNLDKDDLGSYTVQAEKELAGKLEVEGFRPGKAPKEIARKRIGEQLIKEEALNLAVQSSLAKVLAGKKMEVIEQASLIIKENSADRLLYKVTLTVLPEIQLGEYKHLTEKSNSVFVDDAEIKNALQGIVNLRTTLKEVNKPAQPGDHVEVDFKVFDHGILIDGGQSENHPVTLGENKFIPGFEEQIIGLKMGEKKNFLLKVPADFYQKSIAGKNLDFEVIVKRVRERVAPQLDDNFAKSLGQFRSLADLKANIKQGLIMEKKIREKNRIRLTLLKQVADKTNISIPPVLIEKQLDTMIQNFDDELHAKGKELVLYLAHLKKTQDNLKREWRGKAEEQVKMSLIVKTIAEKENIRVSEEEVGQELESILQQYMMRGNSDGSPAGPEDLRSLDPQQMKNKIRNLLLNEKVFELLEKHASLA